MCFFIYDIEALIVNAVMLNNETTIADLGSNPKRKILVGIIKTPPPSPTIEHIIPISRPIGIARKINSSPSGILHLITKHF